jgi:hypothetical protein
MALYFGFTEYSAMKKCFKCLAVKDLGEFYKHKGMADGHVNKCKECNKLDVRNNRESKVEYYREYDRDRGNRQATDYVSSYRNRYPMKYAAHILVYNAVRDGRLLKLDACSACGVNHDHIHGHHDDYAMPLAVRWLCPSCHKKWHILNGEAANAS